MRVIKLVQLVMSADGYIEARWPDWFADNDAECQRLLTRQMVAALNARPITEGRREKERRVIERRRLRLVPLNPVS